MSGTALTMVSPSSVRMMRSVVCVAGCCGPKFRVQRASRSASSGSLSSSSRGIVHSLVPGPWSLVPGQQRPGTRDQGPGTLLAFRPRDHREVMSLASAAQGGLLAQREGGNLWRHQEAAQVRMAIEDDAVHVIDFAFQPVGAAPKRKRRRNGQVRLIQIRLDDHPLAGGGVEQTVDHTEAVT